MKKKSNKILVTGGAGYIGTHVVHILLEKGYQVNVLDDLWYGDSGLRTFQNNPNVNFIRGDLLDREKVLPGLEGVSAVIALGAIVGDPACALDEKLTTQVNVDSVKLLIELAREKGVRRFVFASSCSLYGSSSGIVQLTEKSPLSPVSLYAKTRIECENYLLQHQDHLCPVILRLSTVYGLSPRRRFDLALNNMTARAVVDKKITVHGGDQWRPFVHARDAARAFVMAMEADEKKVAGEIFNVGDNESNFQIEHIARIIAEEIPGTTVDHNPTIIDLRNYNVLFDKIRERLGFTCTFSIRAGIHEMAGDVRENKVIFSDPIYHNYSTLKERLEKKRFIPFCQADVGAEERSELLQAVDSGWLSTGPRTKLFEEKLQEYFGEPGLHCIAVSSCGPGDEVITTPMTFCATVNTILYAGAKPVLVDIEPDNYTIDLDLIEKHITSKTRAIVPVYYGGHGVDLVRLREIADRHGLLILADAAHAMGARFNGKLLGTMEDAAAFSFYVTKNMTTGEGGLLTTRNGEMAGKIRRLQAHGMDRDAWKRYSAAGTWYYEIADLGFKYNFTDIQAAFGIHQLAKIDHFNSVRRTYSAHFDEEFAGIDEISLMKEKPGFFNTRHLYPIVLDTQRVRIDRGAFIDQLKEDGIGTSVHYIPIHFHPFYRRALPYKPGDFPVCERIYQGLISLPIYPKMTWNEIDRVVDSVKKIILQNRKD
jgi:dTDP-4-amino-4,6-dideoxygalactose transaminase/nucleoside-diphosphate-sugar epimerase